MPVFLNRAVVLAALALLVGCAGSMPEVDVLRAPAGASIPQVVIDDAGTLHLVYYTGSMTSGDLWHVTRAADATDWSPPQRVNSDPHSVSGLGPIDGGQLAIGPDGLLHVTWFHKDPTRFHYARSDHTGAFGPQHTLSMKDEGGVETAPTVTVDGDGNVYVFWHADPVEDAQRRVYMAVSRENGALFDLPRAVSPAAEGACGCCGLRTVTDDAGVLYVSYRGAGENIHRGMRLLTSTDQGRTFTDYLVQPWELNACPIATTTLSAWPTQCHLPARPNSAARTPPWRRTNGATSCSPGAMDPGGNPAALCTGRCSTARVDRAARKVSARARSPRAVSRPLLSGRPDRLWWCSRT